MIALNWYKYSFIFYNHIFISTDEKCRSIEKFILSLVAKIDEKNCGAGGMVRFVWNVDTLTYETNIYISKTDQYTINQQLKKHFT